MKHLHPFSAPIAFLLAGVMTLAVAGCGTAPSIVDARYDLVHLENPGPNVNSPSDDFAAEPLLDRLFFTSNRRTSDTVKANEDQWVAHLTDRVWGQAVNAGPGVNSPRDEGALFVASDGYTVYFTMCWAPNGMGDGDIYTATLEKDGRLSRVRNIAEINTKYWESNPFVTAEGNEMYFASDRPGGYGGTDIWISKKLPNGKWGKPVNAGPNINTRYDEKGPWLSPDNSMLIFSSDGYPGGEGFDLYMSRRELVDNKPPKPWARVQRLGAPFNSEGDDLFFRTTAEEDSIYISSSRPGGLGGLDIYLSPVNPFKDTARYKTMLAVSVLDSATRNPIAGARYSMRSKLFSANGAADRYGRFNALVLRGQDIHIQADAGGYEPSYANVSVPRDYAYREMRREILLPRIPVVKTDTTSTPGTTTDKRTTVVYFDFNKSDITAEAGQTLRTFIRDQVRGLIEGNANFEITIDAYTDEIGTDQYNIALSQRRGDSVVRFLREAGVPLQAMSITAHGETSPAATNTTDEGRQLNRRAVLRLLLSE